MALETFEPAVAPSPGTASEPELKILSAEFGDGYSQDTEDGLNHIRDVLTLTWDVLHPNDAIDIIDFFVRHKGTTPFYYTPSDEEFAIKWTCKKWRNERGRGGLRRVSATLRQCFTNVA